jgi:hypothetical protein
MAAEDPPVGFGWPPRGRLPTACIRTHAGGIFPSAMDANYMNYVECDLAGDVELLEWRRGRVSPRRPRRRLRVRFA